MKKIHLLILVICIAFTSTMSAQYKWDYGVKIGASNYLGDIGGKYLPRRDFVVDMHLISTRFAAGAYGRYKFNKRLAVAGNLDWIRITDRDAYTTYAPRRARNANFRNDLIELGARAELTIWYDNDVGNKGYYNPDFKLFAFAGLAGYYSNPKGQIFSNGELQYDGQWFALRPWRTEGQEKSYSKFGVAVPAGLGCYFTFDKKWRFQWDLSWRTVFTDYLDDVSTVFNAPNPEDPADYQTALSFVNQAYPELIEGLVTDNPQYTAADLAIENFTYVSNPNAPLSPRGDATHNDSYLTTQLTITRVIRGKSSFYKAKYSYLKNKAGVRRARAKF
jgi:Outer membrane protein beta-barrel domain